MNRVRDVSRQFHDIKAQILAIAPQHSDLGGQLGGAHWRLMCAETSCNFYWGNAWVYKVHQDLDAAEGFLRDIRHTLSRL
jgi:hypothetical protein